MAKLLSWLFMIPAGLVVIAFTVSNRAVVDVDLWPAPISLQVPLFSVALAGVFGGFLFGTVVAWISAGARRRHNRQLVRQLEGSLHDQADLKEQLQKAEAAARPGRSLALSGHKDAAA